MRRLITSNRCNPIIIALLLAVMSQNAHAFFDPPWITPAAPRAGETVSVNIRDGICDAIFFRPGYPLITREGNEVHLVEFGQHWDAGDLCVFEMGYLAEPIGTFAPGEYTVTVDFIYEDYPIGYSTITPGVVPFTVAGIAAAASLPATTASGRLLLLILVAGAALLTLRARGAANKAGHVAQGKSRVQRPASLGDC